MERINEQNPVPVSVERHDEDLHRVERIVKKLQEPVKIILEQLSPQLESGEIQLIIGDDASGRIPTAIFRKVFDLAYKEQGFIIPETRFIAGFGSLQGKESKEKKKEMAEYLETVKKAAEEKFGRPLQTVLIVTDSVETGKSLDPLIEVLRDMGIVIKIASIGMLSNPKQAQELKKKWKTDIIFGSKTLPGVYGDYDIAGVIKHSKRLFSRLSKKRHIYDREEQALTQDKINKSREIADELAMKAYENWKQDHQKGRTK